MSATIVIFGASGDLTSRKLIPALYQLHRKKRLESGVRIVGFSRTPMAHDTWRGELAETTAAMTGKDFSPEVWRDFAGSIYYHAGDMQRDDDYRALDAMLAKLEGDRSATRIYYLATAPRLFTMAVEHLGATGMADPSDGVRRLVVEKPFGTDLASARQLNEELHRVFDEDEIYRIDHYLGKETVQNIFVLRFANTIFEPVWNRNFVDHIQITAAEEVAVGKRGGYYDTAGVLRDMFQNHLLQLLTTTTMEPPPHFAAAAVRNEKVKVLEAIRPMTPDLVARDTLRAHYRGYRQEPGVAADSQTATFAAMKLCIENWRWQGVPIYLRSGKVMSCRTTQIVIQFRQPPHLMFKTDGQRCPQADRLVIQIQPAEGIQLQFQSKVPDAGMQMRLANLDFRFAKQFAGELPEAYERLLLDVIAGDPSLFARSDEVELAWGVIDPILDAWASQSEPKLLDYEPGGWGPAESNAWIERDGREWFDVCPVLEQ